MSFIKHKRNVQGKVPVFSVLKDITLRYKLLCFSIMNLTKYRNNFKKLLFILQQIVQLYKHIMNYDKKTLFSIITIYIIKKPTAFAIGFLCLQYLTLQVNIIF